MTQLLSPGVYVEELPSSIKAIGGVSTSTAGFIGVFGAVANNKKADLPAAAAPVACTNFSEYTKAFGDLLADDARRYLAHAVYGFFANGGSRCHVSWVADEGGLDAALLAFEAIEEIALVAAPGQTGAVACGKIADHCAKGDGRFYRFAILDGPADGTTDALPANSKYAALYLPWLKVFDPSTKKAAPAGDGLLAVPPSGHVAGVYARVDATRGVHKAPANEPILGAVDVALAIGKSRQDDLNPKGVNCIRKLDNQLLVWGARTLGGDANADLKYVNVRRTLLFLRKSIDDGTRWVVFEPNTPALWKKITRNVGAFLTGVWRSGALFGDTPEQAFYVRCDEELNPPDVRELGRVVTEVGVAIARPAEFVVFRISQYSGES